MNAVGTAGELRLNQEFVPVLTRNAVVDAVHRVSRKGLAWAFQCTRWGGGSPTMQKA